MRPLNNNHQALQSGYQSRPMNGKLKQSKLRKMQNINTIVSTNLGTSKDLKIQSKNLVVVPQQEQGKLFIPHRAINLNVKNQKNQSNIFFTFSEEQQQPQMSNNSDGGSQRPNNRYSKQYFGFKEPIPTVSKFNTVHQRNTSEQPAAVRHGLAKMRMQSPHSNTSHVSPRPTSYTYQQSKTSRDTLENK